MKRLSKWFKDKDIDLFMLLSCVFCALTVASMLCYFIQGADIFIYAFAASGIGLLVTIVVASIVSAKEASHKNKNKKE